MMPTNLSNGFTGAHQISEKEFNQVEGRLKKLYVSSRFCMNLYLDEATGEYYSTALDNRGPAYYMVYFRHSKEHIDFQWWEQNAEKR